jgi:hypothetical protein
MLAFLSIECSPVFEVLPEFLQPDHQTESHPELLG